MKIERRSRQRLTGWFINLKKWQKGGLIGCSVGVIFAILININPGHEVPGEWVVRSHLILGLPWFVFFYSETEPLAVILMHGAMGLTVIIFYSVLGIISGKIQQAVNPFWKWPLTALLAIFLLVFYIIHFI